MKGPAGKAAENAAGKIPADRAAKVEAALLSSFLGRPANPPAGSAPRRGGSGSRSGGDGARRRGAPRVQVAVEWGDITKVDAGIYAVGHYQGVLPQNAELALDKALSRAGATEEELVLTQLTRRGLLRGALGEIFTVPGAINGRKGRVVAVAGMGHPGAFGAQELRRLARNLGLTILSLPGVRQACSVLIGGGAGNLSIPVAVENLLLGIAEALEVGSPNSALRKLTLVEFQLDKAYEIHATLQKLCARKELAAHLEFDPKPLALPKNPPGALGQSLCLGLTIASAVAAEGAGGPSRRALGTLLKATRSLPQAQFEVLGALRGLTVGTGRDLVKAAADLKITSGTSVPEDETIPTRLSYVRQGDAIIVAALTDTAVKPERRLGVEPALVDQHVLRMIDPDPDRVPELGADLAHLVVPLDFRELLSRRRPTVFEVDRAMAGVHWEMLPGGLEGVEGDSQPLSLIAAVSRQLRTAYSPSPTAAPPPRWPLRALVIGDPGSPKAGHSLPGAQDEAFAVHALLRKKGLDVELLVGAQSAPRPGRLASVQPATRLTVLTRLMRGGYDLLHYAGHGSFDPADASASGWLFEDGLLRARQMEQVALAPRLVVANACLSGRTSAAYSGGSSSPHAPNEANLLASLADEFFHRGVRDYIGTAWEVSDVGAELFATTFYEALLPDSGGIVPIGTALLLARTALKAEERRFGALWAAYQHYGDPFQVVRSAGVSAQGGSTGTARTGANGPTRAGGGPRRKPARPKRRGAGRRGTI